MLFSPEKNGFYIPGSTNTPSDAVEINDEDYRALLSAQSRGLVILPGPNGIPVASEPQIRPPESFDVNAERDRRVYAGFQYDGKSYRSKQEDRASITENANLAAMAIMNGAQPGELNWLNDDEEFQWIDANNERVPMDAQSMINLARSAATHKNRLVFAARTLKDMSPIPADYADDKYWS